MRYVLLVFLLLPTAAFAQQQQTPSQVALQINNIVGQWAQTIEALQQQNAQLQARVKELEAKVPKEEQKDAK